jgi:hypothetical protein
MSAGSISDFHCGLYERIGPPNLDFECAMRSEHCDKDGADEEFIARNYSITTTPRQEWGIVVDCKEARSQHFKEAHNSYPGVLSLLLLL